MELRRYQIGIHRKIYVLGPESSKKVFLEIDLVNGVCENFG